MIYVFHTFVCILTLYPNILPSLPLFSTEGSQLSRPLGGFNGFDMDVYALRYVGVSIFVKIVCSS